MSAVFPAPVQFEIILVPCVAEGIAYRYRRPRKSPMKDISARSIDQDSAVLYNAARDAEINGRVKTKSRRKNQPAPELHNRLISTRFRVLGVSADENGMSGQSAVGGRCAQSSGECGSSDKRRFG